ncbi:Hypothetical protein ZOBELLIA_895 [Zobellia galactanivorans]|uniref:Uncharacterized protein n=1 Tax=Zobellia galactanivorans (strain DSM 12802 / CCUG 47099 / CIP 106680 / NCIMB 13871 / Dsij) TaxID=63186 RepID=G0L9X0_ZOBGA|nr:Hypothetical protein ZOBELLIA_895 [Zobellia galactanivorans]
MAIFRTSSSSDIDSGTISVSNTWFRLLIIQLRHKNQLEVFIFPCQRYLLSTSKNKNLASVPISNSKSNYYRSNIQGRIHHNIFQRTYASDIDTPITRDKEASNLTTHQRTEALNPPSSLRPPSLGLF